MQQNKSILCPSCNKLISNYIEECPYCGLHNPGSPHLLLRLTGKNHHSFVKLIISINVALLVISYLLPLFLPINTGHGSGFLGLLPSPSSVSLNLLGWADPRQILSGSWWMLITGMFLHGGILHIFFNMMWVRDLAPQTEELFSPYKMIIIYIISGVSGNLLAIFLPIWLTGFFGLHLSLHPIVGASGAVFGLMGAIIAFGKKKGGFWGKQLAKQMGTWALVLIAMGFFFPGISNTAHIGGFLGGYLIGWVLPTNESISQGRIYSLLGICVLGICFLSFAMMLLRLFNIITSI